MTAPLHKKVFHAIRVGVRETAKRAGGMFGLNRFVMGAIGGLRIGTSATGVDVTALNSLQVPAFYRCVKLLADTVGKTKFAVKKGSKDVASHPANSLVKYWARHHQLSADMFRRTLVVMALIHGNGYGRIVRHSSRPTKLVALDPSYVTPILKNGELRYQLNDPNRKHGSQQTTVSASDIIHIKGFSLDGWVGVDPIRYLLSETMGLAISTQKYAANYYETGGQPTAYVHSDHFLNDDQWANFKKRTAGTLNSDLHNPHRMPVLENMDIKSTGLTAEQTQLLESRKHSAAEIAVLMGIPLNKVGLQEASSYKSLEEENKAFREDGVEPWLQQFETEYRKLLTEDEQASESHRIEANRMDLSKTDFKSRFDALNKATAGAAILTSNDARELLGIEDHEDGDTLHKPPTNEAKDAENSESDSDNPEDEEGNSSDSTASDSRVAAEAETIRQTIYRVQALTDVYSRMTKRLATEAVKRAKKSQGWPDYLAELENRHAITIQSALDPIIPLCGGRADEAREITANLLTEFRLQMQAVYDSATPDDFASGVSRAADNFQSTASHWANQTVLSFTHSA